MTGPNKEFSGLRANSLVLVGSLALCLILAELALRLATEPHQFLNPETDEYWKELRNSHQSSGAQSDTTHDPAFGWRMTPNWSNGDVTHNSRGYRGYREYEPTPSKPRFLAIGDSFTYGLGVSDDSTYSATLERIAGSEVINMGVNGFGLDQALLMYEREGKQYSPSLVVLGYYVDNFNRNALSFRDGPKPYFAIRQNQYQLQGVPVPRVDEVDLVGPSLRTWRLVKYATHSVSKKLGGSGAAPNDHRFQLSRYLLRRLKDSVNKANAELIVLIIGHCHNGNHGYRWIENAIGESCQTLDLNCINTAQAMRQSDYGSFYLPNCHWSDEGHRFSANRVIDAMRR